MNLKVYLKHLSISIIVYFILALASLIYLIFNGNDYLLGESNLLRFDSLLYKIIRDKGYHSDWLCAFFPAFPFVWKFSQTSVLGISIINSSIFLLSASAIATLYKMKWQIQAYLLTIPSMIFMFVPYTESFFFVAVTLILFSLKLLKPKLTIISLFLVSLIRPTTFVFIPAIIGSIYLAEKEIKEIIKKSILPTISLLFGLFLTLSIHHAYTGKWLVFFEAQKLWENYLHFPQLPLRSWGGDASTRYDGSVFFISLVCVVYIIKLLINKIKNRIIFEKDVTFSILYIIGTVLLILLYRDGNLYSLNRFIYATPFIFVAFVTFFKEYSFKWKHVWIIFIASELIWLLFNSFNHIHNFLMFSTITFYFLLLLFTKHQNKSIANFSFVLLILINCIGFIKLATRFLSGIWVG